jgi:molybdate transport system substrate-binding protein
MDYLAKANLIAPDTRKDLLSNQLVLIVPKSHPLKVTIGPDLNLDALLGPAGWIVTGDPARVRLGFYALQALVKLGLWDKVQSHLAPTKDVRGALRLVERDDAPAGIVYSTDAAVSPGVAVAGTFPESSHDRIIYPFAIIRAGDTPDARALLDYLASADGREIFSRRGFIVAD